MEPGKKSVNQNHFGNNVLNSEHDEYKDHQQMKLRLLKPSICGYVANAFLASSLVDSNFPEI